MRNRIILLLLAWLSGFTLMAQVRITVYYKDGESKIYDLADNVTNDPHELQSGISAKLSGSTETLHLDANNTQTFHLGRKTYEQVNFAYDGDSLHLFLLRVFAHADGVKVYQYYPAGQGPVALVQMGPDSHLMPVADDPAKGIISPLRQRLYDYPMAHDARVRHYIDKIPARYTSLIHAIPLLRTNRTSRLPRIKWGLTAGFSYLKLNNPDYDMDLSPEVTAGLFADIPIGRSSFSFHPELLFGKYAASGTVKKISGTVQDYNTAAFNQTALSLPLTMRYNFRYLHGMAVPYLEAGVAPGFAFHNELNYRYVSHAQYNYYYYYDLGYVKDPTVLTMQGIESPAAISCSALVGVGCEWQITTRHSLYTGLRIGYGLGDYGLMGASFNISFNI